MGYFNFSSLYRRGTHFLLICINPRIQRDQAWTGCLSTHFVTRGTYCPITNHCYMSCIVNPGINIRTRLIIDSLILKNPSNTFSSDRDILGDLWLILVLWSSKKVWNSTNTFPQRKWPCQGKVCCTKKLLLYFSHCYSQKFGNHPLPYFLALNYTCVPMLL